MTSSSRKRQSTITTYEQRRRRNLRLGYSLLMSLHGRAHESLLRDVNNNQPSHDTVSDDRRYLIGAIIYKTLPVADEGAQYAIHVFEKHKVQIRRTELEAQALERIEREYSTGVIGKKTFISNLFLIQKYVPVHYASYCIDQTDGQSKGTNDKRFQVNLHFRRKYISILKHGYYPTEEHEGIEIKTFRSFASLNVF
ncbi:uncharacterized protein LOC131431509 [Malaya genurostris]|uniref:uncharacterized protein LOC131431509 n=1 Tax=Malaya genurostris TaxID=325434 RepID=UPI0026F3ACA5|nr:uncharacterized protein LOC131431509 [Malaya genurostris]